MEIVVSPIASKAVDYLLAPIGRACGYMTSYDSYIRQLKNEVVELDNTRQRVQHSIDQARNNMKQIEADVEKWVADAKTVADKARNTLEHWERAKKTCFYGWLPNLKARCRLGREARRTVPDIRALILQSQFERVYFNNALPGRVTGPPDVNSSAGVQGDTIFESRASILEDILNALDDEKLNVIGVYGQGGVGKTTLLEEVQKKLRNENRLFDVIVAAKVSQNPDMKKIQDDIAYALSVDLKDEPSEVGRRHCLFQRIRKDPKEKLLIILDDMWEGIDLEAVGIPSVEEGRRYKLLLTSRYKDVLEQKMCADRTFRLEGLKNNEAFRLFEMTVGHRLNDEELKAKAAQVVEKLAGLPLLIISIGRTLKNSSVCAWNNALIKIDESKIESIVKLSYDHLESEDAKSLFLLCGLIGGTIQVELLLLLGMGLGLFERFNKTIGDSRDRLNTLLDSLRSVCLLLDGGNDEENVTIHDLYSEVVVSTPFRGQNSLVMNSNHDSWSKEKLEQCWAICLGSDRLAEVMSCQFPDLKVLMLLEQHDMEDYNRLDFTCMKELRVLYLCKMIVARLPSSIEILGSLQSLYLDSCCVEDVAILGKLKALQILSFAGSAISRLPKEIGELKNLRSLNLSNCGKLQIIEPGVLKGLTILEELRMKGSFDRWMGKDEISAESGNARLVELKSMTKLTTLELSIWDPTILLEDDDLSFENLIKFSINIGNVEGRKFEGLSTMELKLEACNNILLIDWVQKTLLKTQYLHLEGLREFKKNAHELCLRGFPKLKHLDIHNSRSIKYIANSSYGLHVTAFTILESLFLNNLINLEKICHGPVAPECFSKLKTVKITRCHRLKSLWFLSEMHRLVQLEELQVWECDSMQGIVTDNAGAANDIVELPNLRCLSMVQLPNMRSFCTEREITSEGAPIQVSFPRLESLVMAELPNLEKILYSQPPVTYNNLKSLKISEFRSALLILESVWILKLPNLESLDIERCQSAEVVFDLEEIKVTGDVQILSRLTALVLSELPNLQRMWKQDVQLQGISRFQNLKELFVTNTGLPFLFTVSVAKCLREIRVLEMQKCQNMEAVIVDEEKRDEGTGDTIEFPLLKRLFINDCPVKKFFSCPCAKKESATTTSHSQDAYSDSFFDEKVSLPSLEELTLWTVGSFKRLWHGELPRSSFCELAHVILFNCPYLLGIFPSTIIERLHNLEVFRITRCPYVESLFDCEPLDSNTEPKIILLPKLEHMKVRYSNGLRRLVKSNSQMVLGFPGLKYISVNHCSDLRYIFSNDTASTLKKLECLHIHNCEQVKEVVFKEEGGLSKIEDMSFPCLNSLMLEKLDNLINFGSGSCSCDFASLRGLVIRECRNFREFIPSPTSVKRSLGETTEEDDDSPQPMFNEMVTFPNIRTLEIEGAQCKELWNNQIPVNSFFKLGSLELKHCHNLLRIAPPLMWKRLQYCLQVLAVISCRSVEMVYESDGTVTKGGKLRKLILRDLDNLRCIWQSDGLPFPILREIKASDCPRLQILFPTFTAELLGQIEELEVESCQDVETIVGHEECEVATHTAITFSELTSLRLCDLPKFRSFLTEKYSAEFPSLQYLRRKSCGTEPDERYQSEGEGYQSDWDGYY